MVKTRIYIVQFLGIIMLLCGYFLSDPPDRLSVMHFDSNPSCPEVITKGIKSTVNDATCQTSVSSQGNTTHKFKGPKHISYELVMPNISGYSFNAVNEVAYTCTLPENYNYLFYEEINPPPPKA